MPRVGYATQPLSCAWITKTIILTPYQQALLNKREKSNQDRVQARTSGQGSTGAEGTRTVTSQGQGGEGREEVWEEGGEEGAAKEALPRSGAWDREETPWCELPQ